MLPQQQIMAELECLTKPTSIYLDAGPGGRAISTNIIETIEATAKPRKAYVQVCAACHEEKAHFA